MTIDSIKFWKLKISITVIHFYLLNWIIFLFNLISTDNNIYSIYNIYNKFSSIEIVNIFIENTIVNNNFTNII